MIRELPILGVCQGCEGKGTLLAIKRSGGIGVYAFRCSCDVGQRDPRKAIPVFDAYAAKSFRPLRGFEVTGEDPEPPEAA